MPRKSSGLPKYVKLSGGRYVYRPYIPAKLRKHYQTDKYGYLAPPIRLGDADTPIHKIHAAYAHQVEQMQYDQAAQDTWGYMTVGWLYEQYIDSRLYKDLAPATQNLYRKSAAILEHAIDLSGTDAKLGDIPAPALKTTTIRSILDRRLEQYQAQGLKGESRCNNEKALLSAMYRYGIQYIDDIAERKNPAHGISKYNVAVRERYVTDDEYIIQHTIAAKTNQPYLPIVMELTYLLASRGIEVTDLTLASAIDDGIIVKRRKGSKTTLIRWSPRLRAAWDTALTHHKIKPLLTTPLLAGKGGHPVTKGAIDNAWQKLKAEMERVGHGDIYFHLHDLKRKGITDSKDDRIAGHVSDSTRANYNVKPREFDAPS